jgi:hypothetical protein
MKILGKKYRDANMRPMLDGGPRGGKFPGRNVCFYVENERKSVPAAFAELVNQFRGVLSPDDGGADI